MIYRARYVIPIAGDILVDGEVLVRDATIHAVGSDLHDLYPDESVSDLGNAALLPGFVNAHSHIEPTFRRNFADALNLWEWLGKLGFRKGSSPDFGLLRASATVGAIELARSGVTCIGDASFSGAAFSAVDAVGLRAIVYKEAFGQSMGESYPERFSQLIDEVKTIQESVPNRITAGISPHSIYTSNRELLELCARACEEQSIPVTLHLAETWAEADYTMSGQGPLADARREMGYEPIISGMSPARYLRDVGLLQPGVCLAHCVHLSPDEIELVAGSGASVAHCPKSNAILGAGVAPVPALTTAGSVVGLGTDSAGSSMKLDFFEEMRFTLGIHRAATKDAGVVTAKSILEMATIGGARALGLDDRIGTLEPGKHADMAAIDMSAVLPGEDIYLAILSRSPGDVKLTLVDGREIVRDGATVLVDRNECECELRRLMEQ